VYRSYLVALLWCGIVVAGTAAQEGIRRGKIKKTDPGRGTVTITVDGKDQEFRVAEQTRIMDVEGRPVRDRLKDPRLKEGAPVFFKETTRDGETFLLGLKLIGPNQGGGNPNPPPKVDTSKLKPLPELGAGEYQGFTGGLYPGGKNERPAGHEAAGLRLARRVRPLDVDGRPSPDGKIVLLSVGMSNTSQAFGAFKKLADGDPHRNPNLVLVNGAQGGMTAFATQDPDDNRTGTRFWATVDQRLQEAGVTRAQVQAVWIKQADAGPSSGFPQYARTLENEVAKIVQVLARRFPNLKLTYLSSRTYGGYAKTRLNPEPYAYESGFSVKWLIEKQLRGDPALNYDPAKGRVTAPWLSWGPYLWANGSVKRADGFGYEEGDFAADGTHESPSGQSKVARLMLDFFKHDPTTRPWFVKRSDQR
jgi:hypothetical protein